MGWQSHAGPTTAPGKEERGKNEKRFGHYNHSPSRFIIIISQLLLLLSFLLYSKLLFEQGTLFDGSFFVCVTIPLNDKNEIDIQCISRESLRFI